MTTETLTAGDLHLLDALESEILVEWCVKVVQQDEFENGCTDVGHCALTEKVGRVSGTVLGAIRMLADDYCLTREPTEGGWAIDSDGPRPGSFYLRFQRMECDDGSEPTKSEIEEWKQGERQMWLADYTFSCRVIRPLPIKFALDACPEGVERL